MFEHATTCSGPCLSWCAPPSVRWLAWSALVYVLACALYYAATRFLDTPFHDSLNEEQRAVLADSTRTRGAVFAACTAVAIAVVGVARPLEGPPMA